MKTRNIIISLLLLTIISGWFFQRPRIASSTGTAQTQYTIVASDPLSLNISRELVWGFGSSSFVIRDNNRASIEGLCNGEFDMLATVNPPEEPPCEVVEMLVALDGAVVITAVENNFLTCLTAEHLYHLYRETVPLPRSWQDIDEEFPDSPLSVYVPENDMQVIEVFNARILQGDEQRDSILYYWDNPVNVINARLSTVGYVPLAQYIDRQDSYHAVPLQTEAESPCILPGARVVAEGNYLTGERIFWYARPYTWPGLSPLLEFVFMPDTQPEIIEAGGLLPPEDLRRLSRANMQAALTGLLFSTETPPDFEVRLTWESPYDLDLGLYLPDETQVTFENHAMPGFYRIGDEGNDFCAPLQEKPQERVIALNGQAQPTDYLAFVQLSLRCGGPSKPVPYLLEFIIDGEVIQQAEGEVVAYQPPRITIFSYPEP